MLGIMGGKTQPGRPHGSGLCDEVKTSKERRRRRKAGTNGEHSWLDSAVLAK